VRYTKGDFGVDLHKTPLSLGFVSRAIFIIRSMQSVAPVFIPSRTLQHKFTAHAPRQRRTTAKIAQSTTSALIELETYRGLEPQSLEFVERGLRTDLSARAICACLGQISTTNVDL
jgi:hypothetical protein